MIHIKQSPTADSRTCDHTIVTKEQLLESSKQHIGDVIRAMELFEVMLGVQAHRHDRDKIDDIDGFFADFKTGFKTRDWWDRHKKMNRHHLAEQAPLDVTLIDVLEYIADCVMAGMARSGDVYEIDIDPEVLMGAFDNTVELLKNNVTLEPEPEF